MNRPRGPFGPGAGLDPETAARLRRLLETTKPPQQASVRRAPEPEGTRVDVAYVLEVPPTEGRPVVTVWQRRVPPQGKAEPWRHAAVTRKSAERYPEQDARVLAALLDAMAGTASARFGFALGAPSGKDPREEVPSASFSLSRSAAERLLPLICQTGRLRFRRDRKDTHLTYREAPWALRLEAGAAPDAPDAWDVRGVLRSGSTQVPLAEIEIYLESGFAIAGGELARVDDGGASSWLGMLLTHRKVRITPARRASFLEELFSLPAHPPLDLPGGAVLTEATSAMEPRLLVHPPTGSGPLFAELSFLYDGLAVPARRPGKVAYDPDHVRLLRRDPEAEAAALARLTALGAEPLPKSLPSPPPEGAHLTIAPARLPLLASTLAGEGFRVEAGGRAYRKARAWSASIKSGKDWFDLEGSVDYGDLVVPLPAVLAALRRGEEGVPLGDGSYGLLPAEWLARHGLVLRLGAEKGDRLRFAASQVPLLDALVTEGGPVRGDRRFTEARAAIAAASSLAPADPPASFRGDLRAYQREGLAWLRSLDRAGVGGLLADDMGLGKTVQVLAHLSDRPARPSLVVAPRSLVFNWKREAARFAPHLKVLDHTGGDRRPPGPHFAEHDLVLTTYGTLRRDIEAMTAVPFDVVVLDEAQAIKNDASDTARAARRLRASRRLALSGTPVENHLGELWSLMEFLNPGMLGQAAAWKAAAEASPSPDAVALLGRALAPFLLRRTKSMVAPDLPARTEETWVVELDGSERALYDELRDRFRAELLHVVRAEGVGRSGTRILEALLRLRQVACHAALVDPSRKGRSAKLDALVPKLLELRENGQKALVFSQFRALLDLTRPELEAEGLRCLQLDGSTRDRESIVASFQQDAAHDVLLISLKAGGVGLNLTAAEYVFLLDPWWNPAAEAQAIDRAHRIGQDKPVFAYRLIARDTVEERIAELQQAKRALAESVIRGDGAPLRELSAEDLERLLS